MNSSWATPPRPARAQRMPEAEPEQAPIVPARCEETLGRAAFHVGAVDGVLVEQCLVHADAGSALRRARRRRGARARGGQPKPSQRARSAQTRRLDAAQSEIQDEGNGGKQIARFGVSDHEERWFRRDRRDSPAGCRARRGARARAGFQSRTAAASAATAWRRSWRRSRATLRPPSRRGRTSWRTRRASTRESRALWIHRRRTSE